MSPGGDWCVERIKAYMPRDPSLRSKDLEMGVSFHGGALQDPDDEDDDDLEAIGHTTPQDSIYVPGRNCRDPGNAEDVWECMNVPAKQAVCGTRDYLILVHELGRRGAVDEVETALACYVDHHMRLCGTPRPDCSQYTFEACREDQ